MQDSIEPTTNLWRRSRPAPGDSHSTFFFWLSALGLSCLSLACVCWGASNLLAKKGSENLLRVNLHLPKLNLSHGERKADAFRTSEPVPNALAHPKERATFPPSAGHPKVTIVETPPHRPAPTAEPPRFGADEPWTLMIAKVEVPTPIETCDDPLAYLEPCALQRGDTPMIRTWKMLTMMSLMSAATITVMPQPILFAQEKEPVKIEGLDKLQKAIDALDRKVDALQASTADKDTVAKAIRAELEKLKDGVLNDLGTEIAAIRNEQKRQEKTLADHKTLITLLSETVNGLQVKSVPATDKAFMDEMKKSIKSLEDAVAKLGTTKERTSFSPPTNGNVAPKMGKVKLVNNFSTELLFTVNGAGHRVLPGTLLTIENVPPGELTYEVIMNGLGLLERRVTNLSAGETFTVAAR